jgi:uncharacterized protein VirK/YbjX
MALNEQNQLPAGVLGVGIEAFLPPGVSAPEWRNGSQTKLIVEEYCAAMASATDRAHSGTFVNLLHSMRHRKDWSGAWYKRAVTGLKYVVRMACMPFRHARFLAFIQTNASMRAYRRRDPRLLERHMHRYVNVHWHRRERIDSITRHYRFTLAQFPRELFEAIYAKGHASLGMLVAKEGSLLGLCLRPPIFKGCEGELCLQLNDVHGHPLYRIVFSIVGERPRIVIGCLQGPSGEHAKDVVRTLTRNLHGMRPKQLMLSLVYALARHYGIKEIDAISNDAHPLRRAGRPLRADYDAFWEEQHGRVMYGGWYALPRSMPHKSEAEVPSNHRSAFRRREALRLQAENLVTQALRQPVPRAITRLKEQPAANQSLHNFLPESSWVS